MKSVLRKVKGALNQSLQYWLKKGTQDWINKNATMMAQKIAHFFCYMGSARALTSALNVNLMGRT